MYYQWQGQDLILNVHVQPRASRDEIVGEYNQRLKIRITAPPVDGKANAHLCKFLAKVFGVAKSHIQIISGETGKDKRLKITTPKNLPDGILSAK